MTADRPCAVSRRQLLGGALGLALAASSKAQPDAANAQPDCVFCQIAAGLAPATIVYRDAQVMAFATIEPREPGHLLLAPIAHARDIYALQPSLAGQLFTTAQRLALPHPQGVIHVKRAFKADGLTLIQNNEAAGGQTVFHFHLHLVPRHAGREIFALARRPRRQSRATLERNFEPLRALLGGDWLPHS